MKKVGGGGLRAKGAGLPHQRAQREPIAGRAAGGPARAGRRGGTEGSRGGRNIIQIVVEDSPACRGRRAGGEETGGERGKGCKAGDAARRGAQTEGPRGAAAGPASKTHTEGGRMAFERGHGPGCAVRGGESLKEEGALSGGLCVRGGGMLFFARAAVGRFKGVGGGL